MIVGSWLIPGEGVMEDHFKKKAGSYDDNSSRQDNVGNIADGIKASVKVSPTAHLMDLGAGTGLLLQRLAPSVRKMTAVDVSPAMLAQLEAKRASIDCELTLMEADLTKDCLDERFDGVVSSMTLHHIEDVPNMLSRLHDMLHDGGFIALADLESEDGSFHDEDTGVFHQGFDPETFSRWAIEAGFREVAVKRVSVVSKPQGEFPVFLLTGWRIAGEPLKQASDV